MKKFIKEQVLKAVDALEVIIGILLSVCIAISVIYLIFDIKSIFGANNLEAFNNYLSIAFNFVIGIEFIKMLCKHTPETVIEVLLFAIARQKQSLQEYINSTDFVHPETGWNVPADH